MQHRWGQQGVTMLETLIAISILGAIGVAFMAGMTGAFRAQEITEEQVTGENLARAALENVRFLPYNLAGYQGQVDTIPRPAGYNITVTTGQYCDATPTCYDVNEIQKNTVRVSREGKGIVTVEDLRTKRP